MIGHHEVLDAVVCEAFDGVHEHREEGILLEGHGAPEAHVVRAVTGPAWIEADAVCAFRHLVDEVSRPQAVHAQGQVGSMLLDGAHSDDNDRGGLVIDPVLEGGVGSAARARTSRARI